MLIGVLWHKKKKVLRLILEIWSEKMFPLGSSLDMLMEEGWWWWWGKEEEEEKKKWNWQYHCRSALKGRRSAPLHWSRDVYSGRRRRGRVPLCHRLLCRLTFQLVVIRSSPCLGASFPALRVFFFCFFLRKREIKSPLKEIALDMSPRIFILRRFPR